MHFENSINENKMKQTAETIPNHSLKT